MNILILTCEYTSSKLGSIKLGKEAKMLANYCI